MDVPEASADTVDFLGENNEGETEPRVEGRDEKPSVDPYDPYFGRSLSESFAWSWPSDR